LSCFLVPADTAGLEIAERLEVIAPHPLARLHFDNVRVPADALIGEPGEGFKVAMSVLDVFRSTVGAAALGFARRALDETLKRVRQRELFRRAHGRVADGAGPCGRHGARRGCKCVADLSRGLDQGHRRCPCHP
jgi:alkylation response protein AidB-like acyl-CoA dehydrogenase